MAHVKLDMRGRSGQLIYEDNQRTASAYVEFSGVPEYYNETSLC